MGMIAEMKARRRDRWIRGAMAHPVPVTFLTGPMALSAQVLGHAPTAEYRWACGFFGLGLVDRAGVLEAGVPLLVTDPIPDGGCAASIGELCDARAAGIVAEARARDVGIRVLWSGGIDSTAALVALLRVIEGDAGRLEVAHTRESVREYPVFHRMLKKRGIALRRMSTVRKMLGTDDALLVTGEHGDQIFGSMLAEEIPPGDWRRPWRGVLAPRIRERLGRRGGEIALDALARQGAACPIAAESVFDRLWWWNFSMKWQVVAGRIPASLSDPGERDSAAARLRHFFGTADFQRWSLANPDMRVRDVWASYKWPLKDYIFGFTGDAAYRDGKCKERSLRWLTPSRPHPVAIDADGRRWTQKRDRSLRTEGGVVVVEFCVDGE